MKIESISIELDKYVSTTLCQHCRMLLDYDAPQEWENDRAAGGVCYRCRKSRSARMIEDDPMQDFWRGEWQALERDNFVHPQHYE